MVDRKQSQRPGTKKTKKKMQTGTLGENPFTNIPGREGGGVSSRAINFYKKKNNEPAHCMAQGKYATSEKRKSRGARRRKGEKSAVIFVPEREALKK